MKLLRPTDTRRKLRTYDSVELLASENIRYLRFKLPGADSISKKTAQQSNKLLKHFYGQNEVITTKA